MRKTIVLTGLFLLLSCFMVPLLAQSPEGNTSFSSQKTQSSSETWDTETFSTWNPLNSTWQIGWKRIVLRNSQNQIVEKLDQGFTNGSFENTQNHSFFYSPTNGKLDSVLIQEWNGSSWQNLHRETFSYDFLEKELEHVIFQWNSSTNIYDISSGTKNTFQYGASQEVLSQFRDTLSSASNFTWEPYKHYTNTYDSNMEIDSVRLDIYFGGTWFQVQRFFGFVWENFSQGLWSKRILQNYSQGNYVNAQIETIAKTPGMEVITDSIWINNAWELRSVNDYVYDAQSCIDLEEQYDFFNGTLGFSFATDFLNTYNSNDDPTEIIVQVRNTGQAFINAYKLDYTYPIVGFPTLEAPPRKFVAYPNPFSDQLQLRSELVKPANLRLTLVDGMGKVVLQQAWNASGGIFTQALHLPGLASGIYHYTISDGQHTQSGKLIRK